MVEEWKDIEGYEGLYQVSNLGRIKSLSRRVKCGNGYIDTKEIILTPSKDTSGYLIVRLYKNGKGKTYKCHRLAAIAFIPNPNNLPQINHKDEDKENPRIENLEWCSNKYNCNYGTHNKRMAKSLSKTVYQYSLEGKFIRKWDSTIQCSREGGYNHRHVAECCIGKRKTHSKFKWSYKLLNTEKKGA